MKNLIKLAALALSFSMISSSAIFAGAADLDFEQSNSSVSVAEYAQSLEEHLHDYSYSRTVTDYIPLDEVVASYVAEHNYEFAADENDTTFSIDDDNSVTVSSNGILVRGCTPVQATPERIEKGAIDVNASAKLRGTTDIVEYYVANIGATGLELWRLTQEAQFIYTGSSVSVNYKDAYYERGTLSLWQVDNWTPNEITSLKNSDNDWTKEVRSTATFHWGIEIDGSGLIIEEKNAYAFARCTVNGRVYGDAGTK